MRPYRCYVSRFKRHAIMRLLYNWSLCTHPNPFLKKGGGQGVGTLNAYAPIACGLLGLEQNGDMLADSNGTARISAHRKWFHSLSQNFCALQPNGIRIFAEHGPILCCRRINRHKHTE